MALQHLRSSTAHKRPIPTVMSVGQIAVNTNEASPGLFFKDSNGDLVKVGPVHIGPDAPNSSPASVAATALVTGTVYQILTVGTTDFTLVGASANTVGTIFTATGTTTGTGTVSGQQGVEKGEQWLDTSGGTYVLKIYDGSAWRSESGTFVDVSGDTMTGALLLDNAASASAPDLSFDGDADTGVYSPGANQIAVATNGTGRLFINSNGNIGIGTGAPQQTLDVAGSSGLHLRGSTYTDFSNFWGSADNRAMFLPYGFLGSSGGFALSLYANGYRNNTSGFTYMGIDGNTSTAAGFDLHPDGNIVFRNGTAVGSTLPERLRVTSAGLVGIGTSSPGKLLEVSSSTDATIRINDPATIGAVDRYIGGLEYYTNDASGGAKIACSIKGYHVDISGNGRLQFATGAETTAMTIDGSQRVGIGTTSPQQILHTRGASDTGFVGPRVQNDNGLSGIAGIEFSSDSTYAKAAIAQVRDSLNGRGPIVFYNDSNNDATNWETSDEKMRLDTNGKLGIGTTSPVGRLDVATAGDSSIVLSSETTYTNGLKRGRITKKADNSLVIQACDSASPVDTVFLRTTSAETMRLDANGRLLLATSASRDIGAYPSVLQLEGAQNYTNSSISLVHNRTDSGGPEFRFAKSRGTTTGSNTSVASGDNLGTIFFHGADGTDAQSQAGRISCQVDGTPGGNDMPGRLTFYTTADGASTPTERLRINSNGNVGIGTSNPTYPLTVGETTPEGITSKFSHGADTNFQLVAANGTALNSDGQEVSRFGINYKGQGWNSYLSFIRGAGATTGSIAFATSQQEAFRVDSEGRLLVGTSSILPVGSVTAGVEVHGTATNSGASLSIARFRDDNSPPQLTFGKSRNATIAAGTIVQNGDALGQIVFSGDDGTDLNTAAARIQAFVDGTPGANDMPGRLVFSTTTDGASTSSERMRITNAGKILVGTTVAVAANSTTTNNSGLTITSDGGILAKTTQTIGSVFFEQNVTGYTSGAVVYQRFRIGGTSVGTITTNNGTTTSYNTFSDYRLKENVTPVTDGITRLQQLKPSRFNFIADPDTVVDGFLAHEVQTIVPEAITGEKDAVDDDGNPEYQGIDQSKIVPLLTAALQEAIAKIEVLEQRLSDAGIA